jgi:hypothetical protein
MSRFLVMPVLVAATLLAGGYFRGAGDRLFPVGTVLFSVPGDRLRVEEAGYTALKESDLGPPRKSASAGRSRASVQRVMP